MILLVEDNDDDLELALRAFRSLGAKLQVARDGSDVLRQLLPEGGDAGLDPSVVLLDLNTPLVDGFTVLQTLRRDRRTRHLPVVILTSSEEESDLQRSYELGANSYVQKPLRYSEFAQVARLLARYWMEVNRVPA